MNRSTYLALNEKEERFKLTTTISLITNWPTWFFEDPQSQFNQQGLIAKANDKIATIQNIYQDLVAKQKIVVLSNPYLEWLLETESPLTISVKLGQKLRDLLKIYYGLIVKISQSQSKNRITQLTNQRIKIYQQVQTLYAKAEAHEINFEQLVEAIKTILKANGWKDPTKRRHR